MGEASSAAHPHAYQPQHRCWGRGGLQQPLQPAQPAWSHGKTLINSAVGVLSGLSAISLSCNLLGVQGAEGAAQKQQRRPNLHTACTSAPSLHSLLSADMAQSFWTFASYRYQHNVMIHTTSTFPPPPTL